MAGRHVVVDGSNLATEGRSLPSLAQLDEAVRAYQGEHPDDNVTVVVDATFGHRIDPGERRTFEEAEAAGELVSPPAGAIGRGDRFLLQIADRTGATVLSNDSFQEFHGEYGWLFDDGRLLGGKPVPGVGWIFTPRTPVRGPRSRVAVQASKKTQGGGKKTASPARKAIAEATADALVPESRPRRGRRRGREPAEPVNEPLAFISFIADHPPGTQVDATVESFTSHGAFVTVNGTRCYVPLTGLGDPPPRSAKEVLTRGETRAFVVQALDAPRRGIELALPELAHVAGRPTEETVEAEIADPRPPPAKKAATRKKAAAPTKKAARPKKADVEPKKALKKKAVAKKAVPVKKTVAKKKGAAAKKVVVRKADVAPKKTVAKKKAAPSKKKAAPRKRS